MAAPVDVEAVVVGGGPAGLAAALWLGRYRRSTMLLDGGPARNARAARVHGYLGLHPVEPDRFLQRAFQEVEACGEVRVRQASVASVGGGSGDFGLVLEGGEQVGAARVILATGVEDVLPRIEGIDERYGRSVHHCPSCDGPGVAGRRVAVVGAPEAVPALARRLSRWASEVVAIAQDPAGQADAEVGPRAVALLGEPPGLTGVRLEDGSVVDADALFFTIDERPRTELASALGCDLDGDGHVEVNPYGLTSVDGVYAAGDVTPGIHLVQVAAAKGAVAGIACAESLEL